MNRFTTVLASLLGLFCFLVRPAAGQSFTWAQSGGGIYDDTGFGIAADALGNAYVTGEMKGTVDFGSVSLPGNSATLNDAFVTKVAQGGTVRWAVRMGGNNNDNGLAIAVDPAGNAYVTGGFYGTATFGPFTLTSASAFSNDIYVAKLDSAGNVLWAQRAGGADYDEGKGISLDAQGNAYVTGVFRGTADFGSTTLTSAGGTSGNIFVASYDSQGNLRWARQAGGTQNSWGNGIATDAAGNSSVAGLFQGSISFDSVTLPGHGGSIPYSDVFTARYDSQGHLRWVRGAGGSTDEFGRGVALDAAGNTYVTGDFDQSISFGTTTLTAGGGAADVFVAKYDTAGTLLWAVGTGANASDRPNGIAADAAGNTYVTGQFVGDIAFGNTQLLSPNFTDIFILKFTPTGQPDWAVQAGVPNKNDAGKAIWASPNGRVLSTGNFRLTATFAPFTLTSAGSDDVFIADISTNITGRPAAWTPLEAAAFPNPTTADWQLRLPQTATPAAATLLDALGRVVWQGTLPTAGAARLHLPCLPPGMYYLHLRAPALAPAVLPLVKQ